MKKYSTFLFFILTLFACKNTVVKENKYQNMPAKELKEMMMETNRLRAKKEAIQIKQYGEQNGYAFEQTGSGIFYFLYKKDSTRIDSAKPGLFAETNMIVTLLNGDTCYDYRKKGSDKFLIERANVESGLHEAIQYLTVGDKAIVVLPSHLAHGVVGDRDKIPPLCSVVYDIELIGLE